MAINPVHVSKITLDDTCPECHQTYDTLSKTKQLFATSCGHVFDAACFKTITEDREFECLCGQTIKGFGPFVFLNHAVPLDYSKKCHDCDQPFSKFYQEKKDIVITNCGHLFDRACMEKRAFEAQTAHRKLSCFCEKDIIIYHKYAFNGKETDECPHPKCNKPFNQIERSIIHLVITNCGHVFENTCLTLLKLKTMGTEKKWSCIVCGSRITNTIAYTPPFAQRERRSSKVQFDVLRSPPQPIPRRKPKNYITSTSAPERVFSPPPLLDSSTESSLSRQTRSEVFLPTQPVTSNAPPPEIMIESEETPGENLHEDDFFLVNRIFN